MPEVKAAVLHGTREQRLKLLAGDADVYIINHDGAEVDRRLSCTTATTSTP